jgi:DNA polymerase-3 subunit alpha
MPRFVHLHQHTQYSLLDGAVKIKDLIKQVKALEPDNPAVAITDHGAMHGAIEFYRAAIAEGVKPIIGMEAYVAPGSRFDRQAEVSKVEGHFYHLTLLAKNMTGYKNLVKLATRAQLEGFYYKPRVDKEILAEHHEGLIATTGCLGGEVTQAALIGPREAERRLLEYLGIFGADYYVEVQNHGIPAQAQANEVLVELARKHGLGLLATNDAHYLRKSDAKAHDVLLAIQTKTTLADPQRLRFPTAEFYVKSAPEMIAALPPDRFPGAVDNTIEIARLCDLELPIGKYRMPPFPLPAGRTPEQALREAVADGLFRRYGVTLQPHDHGTSAPCAVCAAIAAEPVDERATLLRQRALYEMGVINQMGYGSYFLLVADYIAWARGRGISVGPGRGSGAGSIVAYCLGITNLDPLQFNLLFERFLNPERISMPDFDVDFSDHRRDEVIEYVRSKYGEDKVAQIATFGTMASKAVIRDVARVLQMPYADADRLSKSVPVKFGRSVPLHESIEIVPELKDAYQGDAREALDIAMSLEGLTRHASVHAAGVVVSDLPLDELVPLMRDTQGSGIVTQYDMGSIEALGLLKFDFLGLRTLSFLEYARKILKESRGVDLDLDAIPLDDAATFELLGRGETAGVFQFESAGMTDAIRRLKPRRLEDLIAMGALYRPGPMDNIPAYIRRHHGQEDVAFPDFPTAGPVLEEVLAETYGICVYQEQVIQIAGRVAGLTPGQADILRRAMGKKKVDEMLKQRAIFVSACGERGVPKDEADRLFDLIEKFANYGFNKAHAAPYGLISYQTAYLKANYPLEFLAALLTTELANSDKVAEYILEARRMGVSILPPDVNRSTRDFSVLSVVRPGEAGAEPRGSSPTPAQPAARTPGPPPVVRPGEAGAEPRGSSPTPAQPAARPGQAGTDRRPPETDPDGARGAGSILFGLGAVKNVGEGAALALIAERLEHGPYKSLADLCQRVDGRVANRRVLESLIKAGALDGLPGDAPDRALVRARLLAGLDDALEWGQAQRAAAESGQSGLFGAASSEPQLPTAAPLDQRSRLGFEKAVLGLYITDHPLHDLPELVDAATARVAQLAGLPDGAKVTLTGLVEGVQKRPTRSGGMLARFHLADLSGVAEVVAFGKTYARIAPLLRNDLPAIVIAKVENDGERTSLLCEDVIPWSEGAEIPRTLELLLAADDWTRDALVDLHSLLDQHPGGTPVRLRIDLAEEYAVWDVDQVRVDPAQVMAALPHERPVQARLAVNTRELLARKPNGIGAAPPGDVPF